jgi:hypothetical protein
MTTFLFQELYLNSLVQESAMSALHIDLGKSHDSESLAIRVEENDPRADYKDCDSSLISKEDGSDSGIAGEVVRVVAIPDLSDTEQEPMDCSDSSEPVDVEVLQLECGVLGDSQSEWHDESLSIRAKENDPHADYKDCDSSLSSKEDGLDSGIAGDADRVVAIPDLSDTEQEPMDCSDSSEPVDVEVLQLECGVLGDSQSEWHDESLSIRAKENDPHADYKDCDSSLSSKEDGLDSGIAGDADRVVAIPDLSDTEEKPMDCSDSSEPMDIKVLQSECGVLGDSQSEWHDPNHILYEQWEKNFSKFDYGLTSNGNPVMTPSFQSRTDYTQTSNGNPVATPSDREINPYRVTVMPSIQEQARFLPPQLEHQQLFKGKQHPTMQVSRSRSQRKSVLGEHVQVKRDLSPTKSILDRIPHRVLGLSDLDWYCLTNNGKLNNKHMLAGGCILKRMFPKIGGLEDTLKQMKMYSFEGPNNGLNLQFFFLDEHWIVILLNKGDSWNTVFIYDSLQNQPSLKLLDLLVQYVLRGADGIIDIKVMNVDIQQNDIDCGLYAQAFATSLAYEEDPTQLKYDKHQLRSHFMNCLHVRRMRPFPSSFVGRQVKETYNWRVS